MMMRLNGTPRSQSRMSGITNLPPRPDPAASDNV